MIPVAFVWASEIVGPAEPVKKSIIYSDQFVYETRGIYEKLDLPATPDSLYLTDDGKCVKYARWLSGIELYGDAYEWEDYINSQSPTLGAVVVFDYNHLGVVVEIWPDRFKISERNYEGLWIVSERWIEDDATVLGFVR